MSNLNKKREGAQVMSLLDNGRSASDFLLRSLSNDLAVFDKFTLSRLFEYLEQGNITYNKNHSDLTNSHALYSFAYFLTKDGAIVFFYFDGTTCNLFVESYDSYAILPSLSTLSTVNKLLLIEMYDRYSPALKKLLFEYTNYISVKSVTRSVLGSVGSVLKDFGFCKKDYRF